MNAKFFTISTFLILSACGSSPTDSAFDPNGSPADANQPVTTDAQAVMDSGTYNVSVVLDTSTGYTTCSTSTCQSIQSSPAYYTWAVTDEENGGSAYSIGGGNLIRVTSGNQWSAAGGPFPGTSSAGCADDISLGMSLSLSPNAFVGATVFRFQAQACNGYAAADCNCAYAISGTQSTSSDNGKRLFGIGNDKLGLLVPSLRSR